MCKKIKKTMSKSDVGGYVPPKIKVIKNFPKKVEIDVISKIPKSTNEKNSQNNK